MRRRSSTPVTVTVCAVLQIPAPARCERQRRRTDRALEPCYSTSVRSSRICRRLTCSSTTVNVAVPPASVVGPLAGAHRDAPAVSSSLFVIDLRRPHPARCSPCPLSSQQLSRSCTRCSPSVDESRRHPSLSPYCGCAPETCTRRCERQRTSDSPCPPPCYSTSVRSSRHLSADVV